MLSSYFVSQQSENSVFLHVWHLSLKLSAAFPHTAKPSRATAASILCQHPLSSSLPLALHHHYHLPTMVVPAMLSGRVVYVCAPSSLHCLPCLSSTGCLCLCEAVRMGLRLWVCELHSMSLMPVYVCASAFVCAVSCISSLVLPRRSLLCHLFLFCFLLFVGSTSSGAFTCPPTRVPWPPSNRVRCYFDVWGRPGRIRHNHRRLLLWFSLFHLGHRRGREGVPVML